MIESEVLSLANRKKLALEFDRTECTLLVISNDPAEGPRTYALVDVTSKEYAGYLADPATLAVKLAELEFESAIPNHWQGHI
jgi:hypothetical protein